MADRKIENCPLCEEEIDINVAEGGGHETLMYSASCKKCGELSENLSFNRGTRSGAIGEWNKAKRAFVKINKLKKEHHLSLIFKAEKAQN